MILSTGEDFLQVYNWYIEQILKVFEVMKSFEILPGVTYYHFLLGLIFIGILLKIVKLGYDKSLLTRDVMPEYIGKHSGEYLGRHTKTGRAIQRQKEKEYKPKHGKY